MSWLMFATSMPLLLGRGVQVEQLNGVRAFQRSAEFLTSAGSRGRLPVFEQLARRRRCR